MPVVIPWTSLLLQEKPGLHDFNHALATIEVYYLDLQKAMGSEPIRDQLLLKPNLMLSHLLWSLEILRSKELPGIVAEKVFEAVIEPLVGDKSFSQEQTIQLVGAGLPLLTKNPNRYLQKVANIILSSTGLLEHLVADENYTQSLKTWMLSKRNFLSEDLLEQAGR